jgi:hypothetical protein
MFFVSFKQHSIFPGRHDYCVITCTSEFGSDTVTAMAGQHKLRNRLFLAMQIQSLNKIKTGLRNLNLR